MQGGFQTTYLVPKIIPLLQPFWGSKLNAREMAAKVLAQANLFSLYLQE